MYNRRTNVWQSLDWLTIGLYLLMLAAGWFCICGASYEYDTAGWFAPSGRPGSQLVWIGVSLGTVFILLMMDKDFFETFAYLIYGVILLLLLLTVFIAPEIKGSRSWLVFGPVHLQPAELAKFATALALAKFMSNHHFALFTVRNFTLVILFILAPMGCIFMQKEAGSALVYLAFALMLYREGMSGYMLMAGLCVASFFVILLKLGDRLIGITPAGELIVSLLILLITLSLFFVSRKDKTLPRNLILFIAVAFLAGYVVSFYRPVNLALITLGLLGLTILLLIFLSIKELVWRYTLIALFALLSVGFLFSVNYVFDDVLEPHQQMRIKVSLGIENDAAGAGYNVNQSKIAIGSGGFLGKGFLNGTQTKLKYVPEQDTDFIFCTIGEEFGFMGSLFAILLFGTFLIRLIALSERQDSIFGRVYGYSVASIFFFHILINIGMVLGLTPVIGIPLPFFSYGGSSLLGFTLLLFIFLRIDAGRKEE